MSHASSAREPQRNGTNGTAHRKAAETPSDPALDELGLDEALREEMERLAAENRQLLAAVGLEPQGDAAAPDEAARLAAENAELRRRVEELEQVLLAAPQGEGDWGEQQKEYEALLEEKSEVIRSLHQKIQELREGAAPAPPAAKGGTSATKSEDLTPLRRQLEDDRRQLQDDEEALEQQMRQMEMAMSRERAELARQRVELQRLHNDLRREIEIAARDDGLRERLLPLQRRQQEVSNRRATMHSIELPPDDGTTGLSQPTPTKKSNSGLLRRLFGPKDE